MKNPRVGMRVRVNETKPYGDHGREGIIVHVPNPGGHSPKRWIMVAFEDDGTGYPKWPVEWHCKYFDLVEPSHAGQESP